MADHGCRQRYADGCRCEPCRAAQAAYRREWKARRAGAQIVAPKPGRKSRRAAVTVAPVQAAAPFDATVTALPGAHGEPVAQCGEVELAVRNELKTLTSSETRLGAAAAAIALARVLDNPLALTQHTNAAKALPAILEDLRKGSARRKGRLASVQAMTKAAGQ